MKTIAFGSHKIKLSNVTKIGFETGGLLLQRGNQSYLFDNVIGMVRYKNGISDLIDITKSDSKSFSTHFSLVSPDEEFFQGGLIVKDFDQWDKQLLFFAGEGAIGFIYIDISLATPSEEINGLKLCYCPYIFNLGGESDFLDIISLATMMGNLMRIDGGECILSLYRKILVDNTSNIKCLTEEATNELE